MNDKSRFHALCTPSETGCWEWIGYCLPNGYGRFRLDGKIQLAHRAAWMLFKGDIPNGMQVCHICDNPKCVAPRHLFLGFQKDNLADMRSKKRGAKNYGEKSGMAKLTEAEVVLIHSMQGDSQSKIAARFGVQKSAVQKILSGHRWPHVFKRIHPKGGDMAEWPEDLRVRKMPERSAEK